MCREPKRASSIPVPDLHLLRCQREAMHTQCAVSFGWVGLFCLVVHFFGEHAWPNKIMTRSSVSLCVVAP